MPLTAMKPTDEGYVRRGSGYPQGWALASSNWTDFRSPECILDIAPRLDIAACPYTSPRLLGFALGIIVLSLGILRPVQSETIAREPITEVSAADRACRHCATVSVQRYWEAVHRPACNEGIQIVGRLYTAPTLQAAVAAT
jgi:hypothetical protein